MGFIKAFAGAVSGSFADQWKDYYVPRPGITATAGLYPAVPQGTNNDRGENYKGSENIITNGSKIVVPEGTALITMQDGAITGFIAEPGGYIFNSTDINSQSIFAGNGLFGPTLVQSWERFKFGGQPATQQLAFYVNLKEIPNNRFGTQEPIAFYDNFLATQVSLQLRGTYLLKIVDPILFIKQFVPTTYLQPGAPIFDFADMDNDACGQLFNEVVGSLQGTLSAYANDPAKGNSFISVQSDSIGFAKTLSTIIEENYNWVSGRGLDVVSVSIQSISYDDQTKALLEEVQKDDREIRKATRMGAAYGNNMAGMMAAASGQAMQSAAANENGAMMGFMGMGLAQQQGANMLGAVNNMQPQMQQPVGQPVGQPVQQPVQSAQPVQQPAEDPYAKLASLKQLLDQGVISQADFDAAKNKLLGI